MTTYHYIAEETYDKEMKLNGNSCLRYYSTKAIKKRYPKGGYIVNGGIGKGLKKQQGEIKVGEEKQKYYTLHYSKIFYGINGYVSIGGDNFLALTGSRKMRNLLISLISILMIASLTLGIWKLMKDDGIDSMAKDYTPPENMKVDTDPNHISIPGYKQIKMHADSDTAFMALWNPSGNPCYFKFTILIRDTKEKLYESDLIPPGKAITEILFNRKIKEGSYDIDVKIDTYQLKDKDKPMNGGVSRGQLVAYKRK